MRDRFGWNARKKGRRESAIQMAGGGKHKISSALAASALPAVVIACLLEIVNEQNWLGWANAPFARLVHAGSWTEAKEVKELRDQTVRVCGKPCAETRAPKVMMINDNVFAGHFNGQSPLDRKKLAAIVNDIVNTKDGDGQTPKVLAIDLDVSPDASSGDAVVKEIEDLTTACRKSEHSASDTSCCRTKFVLIEPFHSHVTNPQDIDAIQANTLACHWVKKVKKKLGRCVHFARSDIEEVDARAIYFNKSAPTLGVIAHRLLRQSKPEEILSLEPRETDVCAEVGAPTPYRAVETRKAEDLINTTLIVAVAEERGWRRRSPPPTQGYVALSALADERYKPLNRVDVVFLGGTWGATDKHITASVENIDGVVVHAAIFDSLQVPRESRRLLAFLIDIFVGTVSGACLHRFWGRYRKRMTDFTAHHGHDRMMLELNARSLRLRATRMYASASLAAVGAWGVLIVSTLVVLQISSALLNWGTWVNPAAMVVGMFLHSGMSQRSFSDHGSGHGFVQELGKGMRRAATEFVAAMDSVGLANGRYRRMLLVIILRWVLIFSIVAGGLAVVVSHLLPHA